MFVKGLGARKATLTAINWFLKERRPAATGIEATWSALRREPRELASLWPAVAPGSAVLADF